MTPKSEIFGPKSNRLSPRQGVEYVSRAKQKTFNAVTPIVSRRNKGISLSQILESVEASPAFRRRALARSGGKKMEDGMKRSRLFAFALAAFALLFIVRGTLLADTINAPTSFKDLPQSGGVYTVNGDLLITSSGSIHCNDNAVDQPPGPIAPNADACDIRIVVTGNLIMQAGSSIDSDNQVQGGKAGDITLTIGTILGNMTMCGPAGAQPGCGGPSANPGALITARASGTNGGDVGGEVTITVGSKATATGNLYLEGGDKTYGAETGAQILVSAGVRAGDISITTGSTYFSEPGSVVEAGGPFSISPHATQQGGHIFIVSDCGLTSQGRVTSKGHDFGADLVHLESCTVLIEGLVESTGKGHVVDARNSCDNVADGLPGEVLRDHPSNSTGCVEVWGNLITIDSTSGWAGELNADIGNGGAGGTSWIDIFASSKLTVTDGTGNDVERDNNGHTYFSVYAVHANAIDGSDNTPAVITALVQHGPLTANGKAFEASSTMTNDTGHGTTDEFTGNGSDGGTIDLEASGNVTLDNAFVNASGDFFGGSPCPDGQGACGDGGHIIVKAWGTGSNISWEPGDGDVRTNDSGGNVTGGDIKLYACGSIFITTTEFHGETAATSTGGANCDVTKPTIPTILPIDGGPVFKTDLWALCGASSISGIKFNDQNFNHVRDGSPLEPTLQGWEIKIWNATQTVLAAPPTTTNASGAYSFPALAPGVYVVCETLQGGWTQSAPVAGPGVVTCLSGGLGYIVDLSGVTCAGQQVTGKDFGNFQINLPPPCPEDPARAALLTRTVDTSKPAPGLGTGAPGSPINYLKVQAAYNAAKGSGQAEVIGLFSNTTENLTLDGAKALTITQCTLARVTALNNSLPVWSITSTGKLTIIGPDSVGGSIGWSVGGSGSHNLKSVRANGASLDGILVTSNGNSVSWNDVSSNGNGTATAAGIRVTGSSNILKGSTVATNNGDGVQLAGGSNNLSGATIRNNTGNGVLVSATLNTVSSNTVNQNGKNGIMVTAATNTLSSNSSDSGKGNTLVGILINSNGNQLTDNKMFSNAQGGFNIVGSSNKLKSNGGTSNPLFQLKLGASNTDQTGNKANGAACTFGATAKTCS